MRAWIRVRPRSSAAIAFAATTAIVIHFAWIPDARFSGVAPVVTLSAGLAHGIVGALVGRRLIDRRRTRTPSQACLLGGCTSLAASALFSIALTIWIASTSARMGVLSYVAMVPFVGFFSFLAAGWALFIVSIGIGWTLFRLAHVG